MRAILRQIFQLLPFVAVLIAGSPLKAADLKPFEPEVVDRETVDLKAPARDYPLFSEFRFGVLAADLEPGGGSDDGVAISGELLTPNRARNLPFIQNLLHPRFHIGAAIHTDDGVNQAYAGLTWDYYLTDTLFVETSFGGAVHDGDTDGNNPDSYGCTLNFRESVSIGVDITESVSVSATVDHMSNAGLCDQNQGLTNAGVRLGYRW